MLVGAGGNAGNQSTIKVIEGLASGGYYIASLKGDSVDVKGNSVDVKGNQSTIKVIEGLASGGYYIASNQGLVRGGPYCQRGAL
eukprot:1190741-Prorocentrum_minimum.AAC.2